MAFNIEVMRSDWILVSFERFDDRFDVGCEKKRYQNEFKNFGPIN